MTRPLPGKPALPRLLATVAILGALCLSALPLALGIDFERQQQILTSRFGHERIALLQEWQRLLGDEKKATETDKLRRVNDFFNHRIAFEGDLSIRDQNDDWATPTELIGQGRGYSADVSIAKYDSLIDLGVPINKLRLVYVKAAQNAPDHAFVRAHMVLAYYATPTADPLVLDNLNTRILPASRRSDLSPVFSFNSAERRQGAGHNASKSHLSRWQDLQARARAEGFQ